MNLGFLAFKDKRTFYFYISPQKGIAGNFVSDPLDWLVNTKFNLGQFLCINIAKENEMRGKRKLRCEEMSKKIQNFVFFIKYQGENKNLYLKLKFFTLSSQDA